MDASVDSETRISGRTMRSTEWRPRGTGCQSGRPGQAAIGELIVRRSMPALFKAWCLGAIVAINGMLAPSLVFTWLSIYSQYSYPIDFFLPLERTEDRAILSLCVAAITVPLALVFYVKNGREMPLACRIPTLLITVATAFIALAFASWTFLR